MNSLSIQDKIKIGQENKDAGNDFFKQGDWKSALSKYHTSILYLKGLDTSQFASLNPSSTPSEGPLLDTEKSQIISLLTSIHSNMAAVYLLQSNPEKALRSSREALKLSSNHVKSVYRSAIALKLLGKVDESYRVLRDAVKLDPNDMGIRKELEVVKGLISLANQKSTLELKENLKNMCSNRF